MLCLFLITSGLALKLSDPVSLRDVAEENVSLRAWCAGVGCVMPFTPASCLSWCDWNVDKQADAEARGAFGGTHWGDKKKVEATKYFINLASVAHTAAETCADGKMIKYYFQAHGAADSGTDVNVAVFPGGDEDKKYAQTYLKCGECYKIASGKPELGAHGDSPALATKFYLKFFRTTTAGKSVQLKLFADNKCGGVDLWDPLLPALTAGQKSTSKTDANGALITGAGKDAMLDCLGIVAATATVNDFNDQSLRKAEKVLMGVQFSGTAFGGVLQPESCPAA